MDPVNSRFDSHDAPTSFLRMSTKCFDDLEPGFPKLDWTCPTSICTPGLNTGPAFERTPNMSSRAIRLFLAASPTLAKMLTCSVLERTGVQSPDGSGVGLALHRLLPS